jgi:hypothetical protein
MSSSDPRKVRSDHNSPCQQVPEPNHGKNRIFRMNRNVASAG